MNERTKRLPVSFNRLPEPFLIWSTEHSAWWRPNSGGYTSRVDEAGRYTMEDARKICEGADVGNESAIPLAFAMSWRVVNVTDVSCSFCGRRPPEVAKLFSGPGHVYICSVCIGSIAEPMYREAIAGTKG